MANRIGSERYIGGWPQKKLSREGGRRASLEKQGVLAQKGRKKELRGFSPNGEEVYLWSSKGRWQARGKQVRKLARMCR